MTIKQNIARLTALGPIDLTAKPACGSCHGEMPRPSRFNEDNDETDCRLCGERCWLCGRQDAEEDGSGFHPDAVLCRNCAYESHCESAEAAYRDDRD